MLHSPRGSRNGVSDLLGNHGFGAEEGTRTPTAFRPPAPKAGASANSATSARQVDDAVTRLYVSSAAKAGAAL